MTRFSSGTRRYPSRRRPSLHRARTKLDFSILPQPDDSTCGPTCLHAVYRYYGDDLALDQLTTEVETMAAGGTLAVFLAVHALQRGYRATIYTYNLDLFDPTWFADDGVDIAERLRAQAAVKSDPRLQLATDAYLEYLRLGGRLAFETLEPSLLRHHLKRGTPLLTGLSATYLYRCAREIGGTVLEADDVRGNPTGHFVVLYGYDQSRREALVADPLRENPPFDSHYYSIPMQRLVGAILLGVLTYDANLLIVEPASRKRRE